MATYAAMAKMKKQLRFSTRYRNRCRMCGRPRSVMRDFGLCRMCFRKLALRGEIPGITISSW